MKRPETIHAAAASLMLLSLKVRVATEENLVSIAEELERLAHIVRDSAVPKPHDWKMDELIESTRNIPQY
jgi:hypothetical protein